MVSGSGARGHAIPRLTRKNDQAWVEQKNGAIVRRLVGHGRFKGPASAAALARLYAAARLHVNLFQPSFKLREKTRVGARVTKRWHPPATPADRGAGARAPRRRQRREHRRSQSPRRSRGRAWPAIRAAQAELGRRVDQRGSGPVETRAPIVLDGAVGLDRAAREGERAPSTVGPAGA